MNLINRAKQLSDNNNAAHNCFLCAMDIQFPISITKMSGAGNDFVIIDHRSLFLPERLHARLAQSVCRRRFSAGADGLILIENSDNADFSWRFYNNDGSVAEMCGNGARCAARYAYRKKLAGRQMVFETMAGLIEAEVIGEQEHVSIRMPDPSDFKDGSPVIFDDREHEIFSVNTGVPHAVVFIGQGQTPDKAWGRTVRYHEQFEPAGTNVNFVRSNGNGDIHVTTYERGVEDITMACGTGVTASALIAARRGMVESPVYVTTAGGEQLVVQFNDGDDGFSDVYLQGAARFVYEGQLCEEAML